MLRLVSLADNVELEIKLKDLPRAQLTGIWLEVVDPTKDELQKVSEVSGIPMDFLLLPESSNVVNLRLEPDFGVINFVVVKEIFGEKRVNPIVLAFSKSFLVTVAKSEDQKVVNLAKERLDKVKVDQPAIVAFYVLEEIVADHFVHLEHIEDLASRLETEVVEKTVGDLAGFDVQRLVAVFGRTLGVYFHDAANGVDDEPVREAGEAESIGRIGTLKQDSRDLEFILEKANALAADVHEDLVKRDVSFQQVGIVVILADLTTRSRSATLEQPSRSIDVMKKTVQELLEKFLQETGMDVRRIGVKVSQLSKEEKAQKRLENYFGN